MGKILCCGIDPGLASMGIGLAEYPERRLVHVETVHTKASQSVQERCAKLADRLERVGRANAIVVVGLEQQHRAWAGAQESGRTNDKSTLARVGEGVARTVFHMLLTPLIELTPAFIRTSLGLPGNCAKSDVRSRVKRLVTGLPEGLSEHAFDAIAIALAAGTQHSVVSRLDRRRSG